MNLSSICSILTQQQEKNSKNPIAAIKSYRESIFHLLREPLSPQIIQLASIINISHLQQFNGFESYNSRLNNHYKNLLLQQIIKEKWSKQFYLSRWQLNLLINKRQKSMCKMRQTLICSNMIIQRSYNKFVLEQSIYLHLVCSTNNQIIQKPGPISCFFKFPSTFCKSFCQLEHLYVPNLLGDFCAFSQQIGPVPGLPIRFSPKRPIRKTGNRTQIKRSKLMCRVNDQLDDEDPEDEDSDNTFVPTHSISALQTVRDQNSWHSECRQSCKCSSLRDCYSRRR